MSAKLQHLLIDTHEAIDEVARKKQRNFVQLMYAYHVHKRLAILAARTARCYASAAYAVMRCLSVCHVRGFCRSE